MKYTLRIDGRLYVVEVGDIHARPVIAVVDGEQIEVWPEGDEIPREAGPPEKVSGGSESVGSQPSGPASTVVRAPIPGVIFTVTVRPGDAVSAGDELCVLEAMKMKNVIRSPRAGLVAEVRVTSGQHVVHGDVLVALIP